MSKNNEIIFSPAPEGWGEVVGYVIGGELEVALVREETEVGDETKNNG